MTQPASAPPRDVAFLLIPGFPMMAYAAAIEPLRAANILAGRPLYRWRHVAPEGDRVAASTGLELVAGETAEQAPPPDLLVVCAGSGAPGWRSRQTERLMLRTARRPGAAIAGLSAGPWLMARAGLLEGRRATLHWDHQAAFAESFPQVRLEDALYVMDGPRLTCSGGIAALDLMLALIGAEHGAALADRIGAWFIRGSGRAGDAPQRDHPPGVSGPVDPRLARALQILEATIEAPIPRDALARRVGLSLRQLERLFQAHLGVSIARHALALRLERARSLLRETPLPVLEVALAAGFTQPAHFSRAYRARYGVSPRQERGR